MELRIGKVVRRNIPQQQQQQLDKSIIETEDLENNPLEQSSSTPIDLQDLSARESNSTSNSENININQVMDETRIENGNGNPQGNVSPNPQNVPLNGVVNNAQNISLNNIFLNNVPLNNVPLNAQNQVLQGQQVPNPAQAAPLPPMDMNAVLQIIVHLMNPLPITPVVQPPQNSAITTDNIKLLLKHIKPFNSNSDEIIAWISS